MYRITLPPEAPLRGGCGLRQALRVYNAPFARVAHPATRRPVAQNAVRLMLRAGALANAVLSSTACCVELRLCL